MARVIASVLMAALTLGAIALTGGGELSRVQTVFGMNTASGAPSGASTAVGANATPMVTATTGGPMVVLGLGDSVMAGTGCGCDGIPEEYSAILRQRTGRQVTAVNEGVPGATSADLLADLKDPGLRSEVADADVIIVSIGANDMVDGLDGCTPSGCAAQSASQAAAMKSRVDAVLTQLRALRGARPFECLVLGYWNVYPEGDPTVPEDEHGRPVALAATTAANGVLEQSASGHGATYVDLMPSFRGADGQSNPSRLLAEDGDHPNATGVEVIAHELAQAFAGA